jgi:hypothetical protein
MDDGVRQQLARIAKSFGMVDDKGPLLRRADGVLRGRQCVDYSRIIQFAMVYALEHRDDFIEFVRHRLNVEL